MDLNINAFGDFESGGNENIGLTTDFTGGSAAFNPINNINFPNNFDDQAAFINETGITAGNQGFGDTTFSFVIREALIPEPSSLVILVFTGIAALNMRRRRCV